MTRFTFALKIAPQCIAALMLLALQDLGLRLLCGGELLVIDPEELLQFGQLSVGRGSEIWPILILLHVGVARQYGLHVLGRDAGVGLAVVAPHRIQPRLRWLCPSANVRSSPLIAARLLNAAP